MLPTYDSEVTGVYVMSLAVYGFGIAPIVRMEPNFLPRVKKKVKRFCARAPDAIWGVCIQ